MMTIALVLTSCGIETLVYLGGDQTPVPYANSGNVLDFKNPADPANGINLYYRIYDSEDDADTDKDILASRQSSENIPGSAISYLENTLKYIKPARYSLKNKEIIPGIPTIPESDISTELISIKMISGRIFIDLATDSVLEIIEEDPLTDDVFELLRLTGTGSPKGYDQLPLVGDQDYKSGITENFSFYVQFFAASYGFNLTGSSTEIYSNAVYLGRIEL
jgi:hypothetical protein